VGQTVNVRNRFINHLSSIRRNSEKEIHKHFANENHTTADLTISILEIPKSTNQQLLDRLERKWIDKLNTFNEGLNADKGNPDREMCIFPLQHNPFSNNLIQTARDWLTKFKESNWQFRKNPVTITKASARNKNLSQQLVRAMLK
jgi:hypothetical protein